MVYLITYDLKRPGQDYPMLYDTIGAISNKYCVNIMDSAWVIKCSYPPNYIYLELSKNLDDNDLILISELTKNHYGALAPEHCSVIDNYFD